MTPKSKRRRRRKTRSQITIKTPPKIPNSHLSSDWWSRVQKSIRVHHQGKKKIFEPPPTRKRTQRFLSSLFLVLSASGWDRKRYVVVWIYVRSSCAKKKGKGKQELAPNDGCKSSSFWRKLITTTTEEEAFLLLPAFGIGVSTRSGFAGRANRDGLRKTPSFDLLHRLAGEKEREKSFSISISIKV